MSGLSEKSLEQAILDINDSAIAIKPTMMYLNADAMDLMTDAELLLVTGGKGLEALPEERRGSLVNKLMNRFIERGEK